MGIKTFLAAVAMVLAALAGCSSPAPAAPVDLTGSWSSPAGEPPQFVATVSADQIEIQIVSDDIKALYWKGTFPVPEGATGDQVITSDADVEALESSILGSGDATKEFSYSGGSMAFEFTAMGVTKTVTLTRS